MKHTCLFMQHMKVFSIIWRCHLEGSFLLVVASLPFSLFFVVKVVQVKHLEYVWIWWKLQNHNFSKKKFLKHVNDVFLVTDEFWIKWIFQKNVIFCLKNAFFWEKWLFHLELSEAQQRSQGTFFSGHIFTLFFEEKKVGTSGHKKSDPFFCFYPLIFDHISSKYVLKINFNHKL